MIDMQSVCRQPGAGNGYKVGVSSLVPDDSDDSDDDGD